MRPGHSTRECLELHRLFLCGWLRFTAALVSTMLGRCWLAKERFDERELTQSPRKALPKRLRGSGSVLTLRCAGRVLVFCAKVWCDLPRRCLSKSNLAPRQPTPSADGNACRIQ